MNRSSILRIIYKVGSSVSNVLKNPFMGRDKLQLRSTSTSFLLSGHLNICRVGGEIGQLVRENDFNCLYFAKPNPVVLWVAITSGRGGLMGRL